MCYPLSCQHLQMICCPWRVTFWRNVDGAKSRWYLKAMPWWYLQKRYMSCFSSLRDIGGKSFFETSKRFCLVFPLFSWRKKNFYKFWQYIFIICSLGRYGHHHSIKKTFDILNVNKLISDAGLSFSLKETSRKWSHNMSPDCTFMYWQDAINTQCC